MNLSEMRLAVADAYRTLNAADSMSTDLAHLLVGRLRKLDGYNARHILVKLKRELQDFDAGRKLWREEK